MHLLGYIYGGTIQEEDLKQVAADVVHESNFFGVARLKLLAEACYIQSTTVTMDNFVKQLDYANTHTPSLLRKAVMDFVSKNSVAVCAKVALGNLGDLSPEVISELMEHTEKNGRVYESLRVSELRHMMEEGGFPIDMSKQAMIETLRRNNSSG